MRIIYVTASLPYGPGEAFIVEELRELIRLGHDVLVIPRSPGRQVPHAAWLTNYSNRQTLFSPRVMGAAAAACAARPVQTLRGAGELWKAGRMASGAKNLTVVPKALWLAGVAESWEADHIHCHWAGTTASMTMLASQWSGIPWSFTAHRWDIVENNALAAKVKSAEFVRVISEGGLRLLATRGIPVTSRMRVLRMGVKLPARMAWNPPERQVVLCPANLVAVKGHRYLLEAWSILRQRGFHGELWLAGGGELRSDLERLAEQSGIAGAVRFLGPVNHDELLGFYERNLVSAVALASIDLGGGCHEGLPVALVEAMSYGVPVVSTATGSIPELVTPGAGMLVPPQDAHSLADAIEMVIDSPATALRFSRMGRRRVEEAHDVRAIVSQLEGLFASEVSVRVGSSR